jgi:3-phenylpropionate/trans-cinnamate dioxygenase ferredoxin reductase subunit
MPSTKTYRIIVNDHTFPLEHGQTVLDAALSNGIDFPHNCQQGACSSCKCTLVSGEIRELADFAYVLDEDELALGMILACQSTAKSDLNIKLNNL